MRGPRFVAALFLGTALVAQDPSWKRQTPNFWSLEQRDVGFRAMEKVYTARSVSVGGKVHAFRRGRPLLLKLDVSEYMKSQRASGLLIIHMDAIRLEKYALNYGPAEHWESFSVAKSITSTLVGAAVEDGFIRSVDETVSKYIRGLRGSAYDDVTIRQLLTMTSGVKMERGLFESTIRRGALTASSRRTGS